MISIALGAVPVAITINEFLTNTSIFWLISLLIIITSVVMIMPIIKIKKTRLMFLGFLIGNCYAGVAISLQILDLGLNEMAHSLATLFLILGILGAVLGTVFGILAAQEAFKRGQAINIVPFSQITINILPILAGLYVFGQIITNPLFFWAGVISIIVGASLLVRFQ